MILVDAITTWDTKLRHKRWSHMVSTTSREELVQMADNIGLERRWIQNVNGPSFVHFDVTPPKRALAIRLGAREVNARILLFANYDYAIKRPGLVVPEPYRTEIAELLRAHGQGRLA